MKGVVCELYLHKDVIKKKKGVGGKTFAWKQDKGLRTFKLRLCRPDSSFWFVRFLEPFLCMHSFIFPLGFWQDDILIYLKAKSPPVLWTLFFLSMWIGFLISVKVSSDLSTLPSCQFSWSVMFLSCLDAGGKKENSRHLIKALSLLRLFPPLLPTWLGLSSGLCIQCL